MTYESKYDDIINRILKNDICLVSIITKSDNILYIEKDILCKCSEVLGTMLNSKFKESKDNTIEMKKYDDTVVRNLIIYLYKENIVVLQTMDLGMLFKVLEISHMYQINKVYTDIITYLRTIKNDNNITKIIDKCCEYLQISENLLNDCLNYLISMMNRKICFDELIPGEDIRAIDNKFRVCCGHGKKSHLTEPHTGLKVGNSYLCIAWTLEGKGDEDVKKINCYKDWCCRHGSPKKSYKEEVKKYIKTLSTEIQVKVLDIILSNT